MSKYLKFDDDDSLIKKQEELDRKEKELQKKEKELNDRAKHTDTDEKNFPPCTCLCFKPFIRNKWDEDMKNDNVKKFVRLSWISWWLTCWCFLWNVICDAAAMFVFSGNYVGGFFIGLISFVLGVPVSLAIYRLLYAAARRERSSMYFLWFLCIWLSMGICVFYAIGLQGMGGAGLLLVIQGFTSGNIPIGAMCVISMAGWVALILFDFYIFVVARIEYGRLGGFATAKAQGASMAASELAKRPDLVTSVVKATV